MKVNDLLKDNDFMLISEGNLDVEVENFYSGDLLSWVMSHAKENEAWCTVLTHVNIIAIASLLQLSCIIICEDAPIDEDTIKKANIEKINLIKTRLSTVDVIKKFVIKDD